MDIYCRKCGEPWEIDSLHDVAAELDSSFEAVSASFRAKGCPALGTRCATTKASPFVGVLTDLLGSDIDGLAVELDDLGMMGLDIYADDDEEVDV